MKETKLQSNMIETIQSNQGLKMYLDGLETGHGFTPRSNLYNLPGKVQLLTPEQVLAQWTDTLAGLERGTDFEQEVYQFDLKQLEKWGPQGGVQPIKALMDDIVLPTFSESAVPPAFKTAEWDAAKQLARTYLWAAGCYKLRPASYQNVIDDMRARDTLESNSGWPLFTKRNKPNVVKQSIEEAESGLWKTYPAIALFRNYNGKTRLVWMFPMSANLVEGSFFQPIQSAIMRSSISELFFAPWTGFEAVRRLISEYYNADFCIAASDFSSTDAHFQLSTSLEVYDVLKSCFQNQYRDALKESIVHMHNIPLIVGSDTMIEGEHGVSSGSNWTNFIETIFDLILSFYVAIREMEQQYSITVEEAIQRISSNTDMCNVYRGVYAIGDDMSWCVPRTKFDPDFAERLEAYGKSVGQQVKAEKTTNDPDKVKSLQRLFQRGYLRPDGQIRAVYPTIRALKSLVFPEKFHKPKVWSKDMEAIRAIMILENCVDHPLFVEFCKFVAAGDPYIKQFAKFGPKRQNLKYRLSKLVPGLNTTYNQERRNSAISDFESVKVLKEI